MTGRVKITGPQPEESWSEDSLEVHPSVELLIARMESHPDEFHDPTRGITRWNEHRGYIDIVKQHWNRREKQLYNEALRKIRLEEYHQKLMGLILK
jgi:hypothetical protein